jgi:curved DNA-binding protein CbpA
LQKHPDTNPDEKSAKIFYEIQEAYAVLSNPEKKHDYDVNNGFYRKKENLVSATILINELLRFNNHVKKLDVDRMDKEALLFHVNNFIHPEQIEIYIRENGESALQKYLWLVLDTTSSVSYKKMEPVFQQLENFKFSDEDVNKTIRTFKLQSRKRYIWSRYSPWIVILLTLVLCFFIFTLSSR